MAEKALILAAVGERIARSELNGTVEGARIALFDGSSDDGIVEVGLLPVEDLPPIEAPGWTVASADGEDWRLYTVEVFDVPEIGDRTLVQLVAPLGDADDQAGDLRRRAIVIGIVLLGAGLIGYLLGTLAARPLSQLRRYSERLGSAPLGGWRVRADYGTPEVDDVARTLNTNLELLAEETARRGAALESARSFAASAAHELRTPLQSVLRASTSRSRAGSTRRR